MTTGSYALAGAGAALRLPAWIVSCSFLGVGSLARDAGHPIGAALLSTVLVWAAPAQLILYGALVSGGLVAAAALAVGFSAIRLLPMTLSLMPLLAPRGTPLAPRLLFAHLIAATTWIEGMRRLPALPEDGRVPFFLGFAAACLTLSTLATGLGFALVGALPTPLAAGLLCLTPIYFTISLAGGARGLPDWLALGLGLGLGPIAFRLVGRDFDILLAGLAGGALAFAAERAASRRGRRGA